jgi:hypothetical protein
LADILKASNQLRGSIARGPTCCDQFLSVLKGITEPKIHNFEVLLFIEQQIFWLNISMSYSELTKILNARYELLEQPTSLIFLEPIFRCDIVEELTIAAVLHYKEDPLRCLYDFVDLNDVRMLYYF